MTVAAVGCHGSVLFRGVGDGLLEGFEVLLLLFVKIDVGDGVKHDG